jgi:hypothetical protein
VCEAGNSQASQLHSRVLSPPAARYWLVIAMKRSIYEKNNLRPLAITFAVSGIWDTTAGILYLFVIGTGRAIDNPHTHSFYSVFLASFFFCFAYLQFLSSLNIRRYIFNVGCLIIGRVFYVIQLYAYMLFSKDFPSTFWFTELSIRRLPYYISFSRSVAG